MFSTLIDKLQRREDLGTDEAAAAMAEIMDGRATSAQIAGFLIALANANLHLTARRHAAEDRGVGTLGEDLPVSTAPIFRA